MPTDVFDELRWRGLVALSTDEPALRAALSTGRVTYYCGFDPTAPSLHIGNLVQLLTMRRLQQAGHQPLALVGGATGLIGDPKPSAERTLNSKEMVAGWVAVLREQVGRFLDLDGPNAAVVVNNLDWTEPMSAIEFLRDIGKHFRVNRMLAKEAVRARLDREAGISYTEFSYQLLQAIDFLELYRRYGCTLQIGGSDQWGNMTAGVDLIRRVDRRVRARHGHAADHQGRRHQVRQDRGRDGVAGRRDDLAVRVLPVLAQQRGRHRRQPAADLHRPRSGGDRDARAGRGQPAGRSRGAARAGRRRDHSGARCRQRPERCRPPARRCSVRAS